MNITTRDKSIKQKIDDFIADTSKEHNKEIADIVLTRAELLRLSIELERDPQEILDNGYDGISVSMESVLCTPFGSYPSVTKDYGDEIRKATYVQSIPDKKWWQFW